MYLRNYNKYKVRGKKQMIVNRKHFHEKMKNKLIVDIVDNIC